ncbi:hypothetical protein [Caballeronia sp. LZ035]|uniref:hypothetical protein n=1 Tax=Caballeronia sp. LZ035 TaxID=3038568 RepID=UPI002858B30B|nr:hypothetical protein [Caballeronia sp. LZ035]MDR5761516.1 hypothetical protein [Caballeronia sp. LZ035]
MRLNSQLVNGSEAFWGDYQPTPAQLGLINHSPTLVNQILAADRRVTAGLNAPIKIDPDLSATVSGRFNYDTGRLEFPPTVSGLGDHAFLALFAHEMGHFNDQDTDQAFSKAYAGRMNPRDPGIHNNWGMASLLNETEGDYNSWKVGKEIEQNTATAGQPGIRINGDNTSPVFSTFDDESAKLPAGLTPQETDNRLIRAGMGTQASTNTHFEDGTYDHDGSMMSGAAPIEPGRPVSARYGGDDEHGFITSGTQTWQSGDTSTQNYRNDRLQSTETRDPAGNVLQSSLYTYRPDGGYGMTVKNGAGQVIQHSAFNADKSGIERGFNADGSRLETRFDPNNQTTLMTRYDARGHEVQKDYFDPAAGLDTHQVVAHADGARSLYSFNDQGKAGSQVDYDADGHRTSMTSYDPETGGVSSKTWYHRDGSRSFDTINRDGSGTHVNVDSNGARSAPQVVNFTPGAQQSFARQSERAGSIRPPQPVGADNALGGQRNYFDSANNRRTHQVVTSADGTRTVDAYNDQNTLGSRVLYGPDGQRISASYFDPGAEQLNTRIDYAADGGRSVLSVGSQQDGPAIRHYNARNQLTRTDRFSAAGDVSTYHDPDTGQITNAVSRAADGVRTVSSYDADGRLGRQDSYDAGGKARASAGYDRSSANGTLTYVTHQPGGGRDVDQVNAGSHTAFTVNEKGETENRVTVEPSRVDLDMLKQWSEAGAQTPAGSQAQPADSGGSDQAHRLDSASDPAGQSARESGLAADSDSASS